MRRTVAVFLICAAILAAFASCGGESGKDSAEKTTVITSPETTSAPLGEGTLSLYFSVSDSLNPYEAVSAGNQQLSSLLFDGLTKLDENLNPVMMLADKVEINGKTCIVRLKNAKFSDGSSVSAEDVTYSMSLAKKSASAGYAAQLENISSCNAASSTVVEIKLKKYDVNAAALLDFPIIKQGSTDRKNSDSKKLPPIGAGRYVYNDDSGVYTLTGNKYYYGSVPENTVNLVNTPDSAALEYNIKSGEVDIYYSGVSVGDLPSMSGQISMVKQTNLVYIGVNSRTAKLKNRYVRGALSCLIDRSEICKDAYYTYAEAATSLFPNGFNGIKTAKNIFDDAENIEKAIEHLNKCGYNSKDDDGYYVSGAGARLSVSLLYNKDNDYQKSAAEMLVRQFKAGGVELKLNPYGYKTYSDYVQKGSYDLYLGEVKLNKNLDFSALLDEKLNRVPMTATTVKNDDGGEDTAPIEETVNDSENESDTTAAATTAAPKTEPAGEEYFDYTKFYENYLSGKIDADKFTADFAEQLPFIPIGYRLGVVSCSSGVSPVAVSTVSDAYYNIELLSVK